MKICVVCGEVIRYGGDGSVGKTLLHGWGFCRPVQDAPLTLQEIEEHVQKITTAFLQNKMAEMVAEKLFKSEAFQKLLADFVDRRTK